MNQILNVRQTMKKLVYKTGMEVGTIGESKKAERTLRGRGSSNRSRFLLAMSIGCICIGGVQATSRQRFNERMKVLEGYMQAKRVAQRVILNFESLVREDDSMRGIVDKVDRVLSARMRANEALTSLVIMADDLDKAAKNCKPDCDRLKKNLRNAIKILKRDFEQGVARPPANFSAAMAGSKRRCGISAHGGMKSCTTPADAPSSQTKRSMERRQGQDARYQCSGAMSQQLEKKRQNAYAVLSKISLAEKKKRSPAAGSDDDFLFI